MSKTFTVEEVLNATQDVRVGFDREQFCRIFYGLEPGQDVAYMSEKWGYFQQHGFFWVYASLDRSNRERLWAYLEELLTSV